MQKVHSFSSKLKQGLKVGVFWDVDGTIADSFRLGYDSTNEVMLRNGLSPISEESYHQGTRFTTPARFAWHVTGNPSIYMYIYSLIKLIN